MVPASATDRSRAGSLGGGGETSVDDGRAWCRLTPKPLQFVCQFNVDTAFFTPSRASPPAVWPVRPRFRRPLAALVRRPSASASASPAPNGRPMTSYLATWTNDEGAAAHANRGLVRTPPERRGTRVRSHARRRLTGAAGYCSAAQTRPAAADPKRAFLSHPSGAWASGQQTLCFSRRPRGLRPRRKHGVQPEQPGRLHGREHRWPAGRPDEDGAVCGHCAQDGRELSVRRGSAALVGRP